MLATNQDGRKVQIIKQWEWFDTATGKALEPGVEPKGLRERRYLHNNGSEGEIVVVSHSIADRLVRKGWAVEV